MTDLLALALATPDWWDRAACRTADREAFFPERSGSCDAAKAICNGDGTRPPCPVREECLAWAMRVEEDAECRSSRHGVFGGLSPSERKRLARGWGA